jgi:uncharacterized BrkB/YihY/UPF0761 family membrane protein
MKLIDSVLGALDSLQQRYKPIAFIAAVFKRFGEDEAGYQAALLTYYGFLSLFPILLLLSTATDLIASSHPELQQGIIDSVTRYFPVLGTQLSQHVQGLHKHGIALIIALVTIFYGTRGVADVFQKGVRDIWGIPKSKQPGFPNSMIKSFSIVVVGGFGFLLAAIIAGVAGAAGHGLPFQVLSVVLNLFILFWLFAYLINQCLPRHVSLRKIRAGAATAAVGLLILQTLGGYLLTRELRNLDALYSYFAVSLGLLFWIYLQARMFYYAVEVAAVKAHGLWPRSLTGKRPTAADLKIQAREKSDTK